MSSAEADYQRGFEAGFGLGYEKGYERALGAPESAREPEDGPRIVQAGPDLSGALGVLPGTRLREVTGLNGEVIGYAPVED